VEKWGARNPDESAEVTGDNPELGQVDGEDPISEVYDPEGSDEEGDALKVRTKAGHDGGARNGFVKGRERGRRESNVSNIPTKARDALGLVVVDQKF